uniref:cytochrome c oxidase subunit III n=1 Tax=Matsucoccus matsumurae TaxID=2259661 RepID=UPI0022FD8A4F|nr:cytochrome c oxidase subunit III [Matsucoccus matsumurae]WBG67623.1 cytochrome c oxidase subunit III [Matsucoccus matsumurae]WRQ20335.1 cytochrome c oxidase subunit III [Matsucoccus matsumurae]
MKINLFFMNMNLNPYPLMMMLSLSNLTMNMLLNFINMKNLMMLNLLITMLIMFNWLKLSNKEKLMGYSSMLMSMSMKSLILIIIMSEIMFFFTFFYIYYSNKLLPYFKFNNMWPLKLFNLNMYLTYMNTILLLLSSLTISLSLYYNNNLNFNKFMINLMLTNILALYFIMIQFYEYYNMNFNSMNSIYWSNFYILTLFHMSHILMGMLLMMNMFYNIKMWIFNNLIKFKMISWYWHFVDFIWIMIFFFIY